MVLTQTGTCSIVVGIAVHLDSVDDYVSAIMDAYRHDVSLLIVPALPEDVGVAWNDVRRAARDTRLHVLLGNDILVDSMGSLLDEPPFETPFGRISTTPRQTAGSIRYVTLTRV